MCRQNRERGNCHNYVIRWYYETKNQECKKFVYGGCGGNLNNFKSSDTCEQSCKLAEKLPEKEEDIDGFFIKTY